MVQSFIVLDKKIAREFHEYAAQTQEYPSDRGEMQRLRIQLQKLCRITELEAINVLIYRNVKDYIRKYNGASNRNLLTNKPTDFTHKEVRSWMKN